MYSAELTIVPVIWLVFNLSTNRSKKPNVATYVFEYYLGFRFKKMA